MLTKMIEMPEDHPAWRWNSAACLFAILAMGSSLTSFMHSICSLPEIVNLPVLCISFMATVVAVVIVYHHKRSRSAYLTERRILRLSISEISVWEQLAINLCTFFCAAYKPVSFHTIIYIICIIFFWRSRKRFYASVDVFYEEAMK